MSDNAIAILVMLVYAAAGAPVFAAFLKLWAKLIVKLDATWGQVLKTTFAGTLATLLIGITLMLLAGAAAGEAGVGLAVLMLCPIGLLVMSAMVSTRLGIAFGWSLLLSFLSWTMCAAIGSIATIVLLFLAGFVAGMTSLA